MATQIGSYWPGNPWTSILPSVPYGLVSCFSEKPSAFALRPVLQFPFWHSRGRLSSLLPLRCRPPLPPVPVASTSMPLSPPSACKHLQLLKSKEEGTNFPPTSSAVSPAMPCTRACELLLPFPYFCSLLHSPLHQVIRAHMPLLMGSLPHPRPCCLALDNFPQPQMHK